MGPLNMKVRILYDATRLLARHDAATPTGIDRVDLRYALYFYESHDYEAVYVHQNKGRFFIVDRAKAIRLIRTLERRWLKPDDRSFESLTDIYNACLDFKARNRINEIAVEKFFELDGAPSAKKSVMKSIDVDFLKFLLENRENETIYFNCSHHSVGNVAAYYVLKAVVNVRIVFYLHDLIPIDYPEYVRKDDDKTHSRRVLAMAVYGDLVLVNSECTKGRFEDFCRRNDLAPPKTIPLLIGVEETFLANLERIKTPDNGALNVPYFIAVSTIEPRKNYLLLLQIWRRLSQELGKDCPKLVIVGKRGWNVESVTDMLDRCDTISDNVLELNGLDDRQLIRLLRNARALLSPSFCEGWGMPLVEAMALGVPVICSDIPAYHESTREHAEFLDPLNGEAWCHTILRHCTDPEFAEAAKAKLAGYVLPMWSDHFASMKTEIDDLLLNGKPMTPVEVCDQRWAEYVERFEQVRRSSPVNWFHVTESLMIERMDERQFRKYRKLKRDPKAYFRDALRNMVGRRAQGKSQRRGL